MTKQDAPPRVRPLTHAHTLLHQCDSWEMHHVHGGPWPWYKLRYARRRRNLDGNPRHAYWLAWNMEEKRLARSSDLAHFEKHNPRVLAWIVNWLTRWSPSDKR